MYRSIKKIAKLILPRQFLEKNELFFRALISLKYKGNKYQCNICNFKLSRFVILSSQDLLCPNCGSLSRTRRLYKFLIEENVLNGNVLHFSPTRILYKKFKALKMSYYSTDFEDEFTADYRYDITSLPIKDNFFDVIICYHVLEHIKNDTKAMSELYRVIKPGGLCYIQTPYKEGEIYEDFSITSPKERKNAFGQEDHVRIYSMNGLEKRLKSTGFKTHRMVYKEDANFGLKNETVIIVEKQGV